MSSLEKDGGSSGPIELLAKGMAATAVRPAPGLSMHGSEAARRQAITELLFFASVGDLARCKNLCDAFSIDISDPRCCDYDKRTPLHLAAAEGAFSVVQWLLRKGAHVNAVDRFKRTPLEDAVLGDHGQVAQLLESCGGKVLDRDNPIEALALVDISRTKLAQSVRYDDHNLWEIDATDIEFVKKLGEGEFGEVHMGRWNGTLVAVKVLHKSDEVAMGDFRTELNVLMRTHHPHTVQFLGAVTKTMPLMIVAELMAGGSLADLLKTGLSLSRRRMLDIALDTARGMVYLHGKKPQGVIHRDLKPANLMIAGNPYRLAQRGFRERLMLETGIVKIADFGLSKSLTLNVKKSVHHKLREATQAATLPPDPPKDAGANHAQSGDAADAIPSYQLTGETGSYRYMAPEVFRHEPYNNKVDVYAYGMIVYYLFEGVPPFYDMDPIAAARAASLNMARPQFLNPNSRGTRTPKEIQDLVRLCWDESPSRRPEFYEIVETLEGMLAKLPPMRPILCGTGGSCTVQ